MTQARIQEAIDNMRQGRTVVIIAHRLSTIVGTDRILFMQDGKILAEGTHQELIDTCEAYQSLATLETSVEAEPSVDIQTDSASYKSSRHEGGRRRHRD